VIEAVTFDFWNTIARVPPDTMTAARRHAVAAACEECGVEVEAAQLAASLEEVGSSYQRSWEAGEHFHPRQGAQMLAATIGAEGAAGEAVAEAFLTAGRSAELIPAPEIGIALEELRRRGLRLGIVCDVGFSGGALLRGLLDDRGLLEHFSGWGFSDEVGHYKPSPQIFEAALGALGASPEAALHIGDLRRTDVAGAAALGMRTVRYRGLHDDADSASGVEAEAVVDSHLQLLDLVSHLADR
jgi:putative hydrolase of the HAD superfamily